MKLPNFQVIKTDDNLFKLVSDAGHSHYKEAIEMLLQSEMFIKHNAHLLSYYHSGLCMIESDTTGEIPSIERVPNNSTIIDYAKLFIEDALFIIDCLNITIKNADALLSSFSSKRKERLLAVIELVKKVFPEITQTN